MSRTRRGWRTSKPFATGHLNRVIDAALHPFFDTHKGFILVDGILHGALERNPRLSLQKFAQYNLPHLLGSKKAHRKAPGTIKRHYTRNISVNRRYLSCQRQKAGPWCLNHGAGGRKCPNLTITYKSRVRM